MIVDVLIRFELDPADSKYPPSNNEMLSDLQTYLRLKEADGSLQCNGTKLAIRSFITKVVRLDRQ